MLKQLDNVFARYDIYWSKVDPNWITMLRLGLVPFALVLLLLATPLSLMACLLLMVIIEITDRLDGYVARKFDKASDWGKLYDPMADVVYHLSMYLALIHFLPSKIFVVLVAIIFFREIRIAYLRAECASRGLILAALPMGKAKVATQIVSTLVCVIWLLMQSIFGSGIIAGCWYFLASASMGVTAGLSIVSLFYYQSYVKKQLRSLPL